MKRFLFCALVVCSLTIAVSSIQASPAPGAKPDVGKLETPSPVELIGEAKTPLEVENGETLLVEKIRPDKNRNDSIKNLKSEPQPIRDSGEVKTEKSGGNQRPEKSERPETNGEEAVPGF